MKNKNFSSPLPYKVSILGKSLSEIYEEKDYLTYNLASDSDKAKDNDLPLESNLKGLDSKDSESFTPQGQPLIRLERLHTGSFYFSGLESISSEELLHSDRLKEIYESITGIVRELESINDRGYITSTKLSDFPVLSGYLEEYVN